MRVKFFRLVAIILMIVPFFSGCLNSMPVHAAETQSVDEVLGRGGLNLLNRSNRGSGFSFGGSRRASHRLGNVPGRGPVAKSFGQKIIDYLNQLNIGRDVAIYNLFPGEFSSVDDVPDDLSTYEFSGDVNLKMTDEFRDALSLILADLNMDEVLHSTIDGVDLSAIDSSTRVVDTGSSLGVRFVFPAIYDVGSPAIFYVVPDDPLSLYETSTQSLIEGTILRDMGATSSISGNFYQGHQIRNGGSNLRPAGMTVFQTDVGVGIYLPEVGDNLDAEYRLNTLAFIFGRPSVMPSDHEYGATIYWSSGDLSAALDGTNITYGDIIHGDYKTGDAYTTYNNLTTSYPETVILRENVSDPKWDYDDYGFKPSEEHGSDDSGSIFSPVWDFLTGIPEILGNFIGSLLEGLLGLVESIVGIFIPSAEQIDEIGDMFSGLNEQFTAKFSAVLGFFDVFQDMFTVPDEPISFEIPFGDDVINIMPEGVLQSLSTVVKPFLTGALVISTLIDIYKRFGGSGDVIGL